MTVHSPISSPPGNVYGLRQIAGMMGYHRKDNRALLGYITALIDQRGFPPPLPTLTRGAAAGAPVITDLVTARSMWRTQAVDAWLDNFLPPAATAAREATARTAAAHEMDHAAGHLRCIAGGRA